MNARPEPADRDDDVHDAETTESPAAFVATPDGIAPLLHEDLSDEWQLSRCRTERYGAHVCPVLGDYRLLRRLGRGGMGAVYSGIHPRLGNVVAVKVLHQHLVGRDPSIRRRFEQEARLAARLSAASTHLVRVHDVNHDSVAGCHFLVMEYIAGVAAELWAHSVVADDGMTAELDVIDVCLAATKGLVAAHRSGVIHRDVKPANILIPFADGGPSLASAKLADLGLARPEHVDEGLTAAGQVMLGTPGYAAPEQLERGAEAGKASDVFAMGATIYRLLVGEAPFQGETPMARAIATIEGKRTPLRDLRSDVCDAVDALVETCLQRDPCERFPDASALAEALHLCRRAVINEGAFVQEIPSRVIELVNRGEDGKSALSTYASRVLSKSSRVLFDSGPPCAHVVLTSRDGATPPLEYVLSESGCFEALDVPLGAYRVVARHDDHEDMTALLTVRAGVDVNFPLQMRERNGLLVLSSTPEAAEVLVDGVRLGVTPLPHIPLPAGSHEVRVQLAGHGPVCQEVEVRGGRTVDLGCIRLERRATLDFSEYPDDVAFALDGQAVADGDEVDPGVRRLSAARPGHEPQVVTLRVEPGAVLRPVLARWQLNARALLGAMDTWSSAADSDRRRAARSLARGRAELEFTGLAEFGCGARTTSVALFRHLPTALEMALVPGGSFTMGSPFDEPRRRSDEQQHGVSLAPFLVSRTTVPYSVWCAVMEEPLPAGAKSDHAALVRDWARATEFCRKTGLALPTEAQWEHACRAGATDAYSWGPRAADAQPHASLAGGWGAAPCPVGEHAPNAFGICDMHGGVWEWCHDLYGEYPAGSVADPSGAHDGVYRVLRGGSRCDPPHLARAAYRLAAPPARGPEPVGIRVVAVLHEDDASDPVESSLAGMEVERV